MTSGLRIAVAGGGIAGCAATLLLARDGHAVSLFERLPAMAPGGTGILLQPAGLEVLRGLGLADAALAAGTPIHGILARSGAAQLMELRYSDLRDGLFALGIRRPALAQVLFEAAQAAGCALRTGIAITGVTADGDGVALADRDGGTHGPFDLTLVCDGLGSKLRQASLPGARLRTRAHERGVLTAVAALPPSMPPDKLLQRLRGRRDAIGLLPIGRGAGRQPLASFFWNVRDAEVPALREHGYAAWRHYIAGFAPEADELLGALPGFDALTFYTTSEISLRPWCGARVAVLGDAAHGLDPHLGVGATMALLDAAALAASLRAHVRDVPAALAAFEARRRRDLAPYARVSRVWSRLDAWGMVALRRELFMVTARSSWLRRRLLNYVSGFA